MKKVLILLLLAVFLAPCVSSAQSPRQASQRISFDFIDADVRNVLRVLAEVGKKNIVIADDVKGKVTIKLQDVPLDEAFDVVLRNNDLAKIEEENIVRVVTLKKLNEERDRSTKEKLDFLKEKEAKLKTEEEFVTETVYVNYADVEDVEKMVKGETSSQTKAAPPPAAGAAAAVERSKGSSFAERRHHPREVGQGPHYKGYEGTRDQHREADQGTRHEAPAGADRGPHSPGELQFFKTTRRTVGCRLQDQGTRGDGSGEPEYQHGRTRRGNDSRRSPRHPRGRRQ